MVFSIDIDTAQEEILNPGPYGTTLYGQFGGGGLHIFTAKAAVPGTVQLFAYPENNGLTRPLGLFTPEGSEQPILDAGTGCDLCALAIHD